MDTHDVKRIAEFKVCRILGMMAVYKLAIFFDFNTCNTA
jgi:hypothetical protein